MKQRPHRPSRSPVVKRSVVIHGHKTSVSLEDAFWRLLKGFAAEDNISLSEMIRVVDAERKLRANLSSALRLKVVARLEAKLEAGGARVLEAA